MMATTVRITETYDMKTTIGQLGFVGIHTPSKDLIEKLYPGLMKNHRFIRFKRCDVVGACASVLPADPLQVGVTAGAIAPEDMFNPLLYKAVTNSSFDTLMQRIYALASLSTGSLSEGKIDTTALSADNQMKIYYSLLSAKGYKKAMPQAGFKVRGLVPICHTLISEYGNVTKPNNFLVTDADTSEERGVPDLLGVPEVSQVGAVSVDDHATVFRGKSVKMPKLPLHYTAEDGTTIYNPFIPKTFVMALITPPAKLHEFFYRVRVSWLISFENPVSLNEYGSLSHILSAGEKAHASNYTYVTSKADLPNSSDMVEADGVNINKIMES